jgi:serine protease AprX
MTVNETPEKSNGGLPGPIMRDPLKFDPETLDRTLISLELLAAIRTAADSEVLDVIIDLNLEYPEGRDAARRWIAGWLRKRFAQSASGAPAVSPDAASASGGSSSRRESTNTAKSRFSQQYIFAALTPASIRALVADVKSGTKPVEAADANAASPGKKRSAKKPGRSPVYKIWLDHDLKSFANVSIVTVKADAARAAFSADGQNIVWAVADSGIDADHPHFAIHGNLDSLSLPLKHRDFTRDGDLSDTELERAARQDEFGHGTHVAGIIAGEIKEIRPNARPESADGEIAKKKAPKELAPAIENAPALAFRRERDEAENVSTKAIPLRKISGMAPCCKLLSLKVLDDKGQGKASNLIAAIEYIQHLNGNGRLIRVHGVNISVGYSYKPEWFACGQSPLCIEIDRLVRSGVSVVVAAGNDGYGFVNSLNAGSAAAGLDVTIADPGNADLAITVGSTHRECLTLTASPIFRRKDRPATAGSSPTFWPPERKSFRA